MGLGVVLNSPTEGSYNLRAATIVREPKRAEVSGRGAKATVQGCALLSGLRSALFGRVCNNFYEYTSVRAPQWFEWIMTRLADSMLFPRTAALLQFYSREPPCFLDSERARDCRLFHLWQVLFESCGN